MGPWIINNNWQPSPAVPLLLLPSLPLLNYYNILTIFHSLSLPSLALPAISSTLSSCGEQPHYFYSWDYTSYSWQSYYVVILTALIDLKCNPNTMEEPSSVAHQLLRSFVPCRRSLRCWHTLKGLWRKFLIPTCSSPRSFSAAIAHYRLSFAYSVSSLHAFGSAFLIPPHFKWKGRWGDPSKAARPQ